MKTLLLLLPLLALCSCSSFNFAGVVDTPYGELTYRTPPVVEPTK